LQDMLDKLRDWCAKWKMNVNGNKTKVVHFRTQATPRTLFQFAVGLDQLEVVSSYRYLGLVVDEFLNYDVTARKVSESAQRALGALIAKDKSQGGMPYLLFTKLYDTLVQPVIYYGAAVWGQREFSCINAVQNRACRYYLGVGKFTPVDALRGDMGWSFPMHRQWLCVSRLWHRLVNMEDSRVNYRVFAWARRMAQTRRKNWVYRMEQFYRGIDLGNYLDNDCTYKQIYRQLDLKLSQRYRDTWHQSIMREGARRGQGRNKLRTYRLFKQQFRTECYVKQVTNKSHRRALALFRSGTARIRIETGRYEGGRHLPEEQRVCFICTDKVESESHVILECPLYEDLRVNLFNHAESVCNNFLDKSDNDRLCFLLSDESIVCQSAKTLCQILCRRRDFLYSGS
jgi:hypothetical protein